MDITNGTLEAGTGAGRVESEEQSRKEEKDMGSFITSGGEQVCVVEGD